LAAAPLTAPRARGACRGGETAIGFLRSRGARMTERRRTFRPRVVLLFASCLVVTLLLGGSLALGVGSEQSTHRQVILFAEVLSLLLDNYRDHTDPDRP